MQSDVFARRLAPFTTLFVLWAATVGAQSHANHGSGLPHNIPDFCATAPGTTLVAAGTSVTWSGAQSRSCVGIHGTVVLTGELTADTIMVYADGFLDVRSGASIVIRNTAINLPTDPEQYGTGLLIFGRLRVLGAEKTPFVRLASAPSAGQITLSLSSAPSGWSVGDEVFVPDTRSPAVEDWFNPKYAPRHEIRTITGISGTTVTLNSALSYEHRGARDADGTPTVLSDGTRLLPHVANLTRSVVIRSQSPTGTRAHMLLTDRASVEIRGAALRDMGRTQAATLDSTTFDANGNVARIGTNQVGRYPLHIHHLKGPVNPANTGYQFQIVGNVIRDSAKWPIAVHASHFGLVEGNVIIGGSRNTGSGISLEDGSETENMVRRNFVADIRGDTNPRQSGSDTTTPGTAGECIWAAGFNNRFVENVVTGCRNATQQIVSGVGFKFFTPAAPGSSSVRNPLFRGADMTDPAQTSAAIAQRQPILQFDKNEAYGLMADGMTIWHLGTDGYQFHSGQPETVIRNFRVWHTYEGAIWNYPTNRLTIENLAYRFDQSTTIYPPAAIQSGDYRVVNLTVRGGDIHAGAVWIGWDPVGTIRFEDVNATTSDHAFDFHTPSTPGTQAGRSGLSATMVLVRPRIHAWPGRPLRTIAMDHDVTKPPADISNPYQVYVTDDQGIAGNSFRPYFTVQASQNLYGGRAPCSDTTSRPEVAGLACGAGTPPPASPPPPAATPPPATPPPTTTPPAAPTTPPVVGGGTTPPPSSSQPPATPPPATGPSAPPVIVPAGPWTVGDVDGDRLADLNLFRPSNNTWFSIRATTGYTSGTTTVWGVAGDIPVPGDYDGDRKMDVAVFRPRNGTWYISTSSSNFTSTLSFTLGVSTDVPVPADYDGDGKTDAAVFRPSLSRWYVRSSSSNFSSVKETTYGNKDDIPAPADFDGDGKADFVTFRVLTKEWFVKLSKDARTFRVRFGKAADLPVVGDYDGDGKADLALYDSNASGWTVRTSSSGFTKEIVRASGRKGDVPVVIDRDGDGKTDFVAFHPPTASWYALTTSAPVQAGVLLCRWGANGDVPVPRLIGR